MYEIEALTKMIRTKVTMNTRTSICSLLINRVHARDTLKNMIESDVRSAADFYWQLQMKYEFKSLAKGYDRNLIKDLRSGKSDVGESRRDSGETGKNRATAKANVLVDTVSKPKEIPT